MLRITQLAFSCLTFCNDINLTKAAEASFRLSWDPITLAASLETKRITSLNFSNMISCFYHIHVSKEKPRVNWGDWTPHSWLHTPRIVRKLHHLSTSCSGELLLLSSWWFIWKWKFITCHWSNKSFSPVTFIVYMSIIFISLWLGSLSIMWVKRDPPGNHRTKYYTQSVRV